MALKVSWSAWQLSEDILCTIVLTHSESVINMGLMAYFIKHIKMYLE